MHQAKVKPRAAGNALACAPLAKEVLGRLPPGTQGFQQDGSLTEANGVRLASLSVAKSVSSPAQAPLAAHELTLCYDRLRRFSAPGPVSLTASFQKGGKFKKIVAAPNLPAVVDAFSACVGALGRSSLKTALKDGGVLTAKLEPPNPALLLAPPLLADDVAPLLLTALSAGPRSLSVQVRNRTKTPYIFARKICGLTTLRVLGNGLRPLAADEPPCAANPVTVEIAPGAMVLETVEVRAREGFKHMPYTARVALPVTAGAEKGLICSNQVVVETDP